MIDLSRAPLAINRDLGSSPFAPCPVPLQWQQVTGLLAMF